MPCLRLVHGALVVRSVGVGGFLGSARGSGPVVVGDIGRGLLAWVIATCVFVCIMVGSGYSAWTYVREAQCLIFCLMHGMTVRLSLTVMTATSVTLFVRGGSDMSAVRTLELGGIMDWKIVQDGDTLCAIDPVSGMAAHGRFMVGEVYAVAEFVFREDAYAFLGDHRFEPRLRDGASEDGRRHCPDCVASLANWEV